MSSQQDEGQDWIKYRIYCETDQRWEFPIVVEGDPIPTQCPVNTTHTVNVNSVDIETRRGINETVTVEESVKTGGRFVTHTVSINADCNAVTVYNEAAFVDLSALSVSFTTTDMHKNDSVCLIVAQNSTVGVILAPVAINDNLFTVSPTVFQYAFKGPCHVCIFDGVNRAELGRIKSLDKNAGTVTTEFGSDQVFAPGATTFFQISVVTIRDTEFGPGSYQVIGSSKIGGSHVKQDTMVTLEYHNRSLPWPVGQITSDVAISDNVIHVDSSVLDAVELGDKLQLADKQQTTIAIGQITQIDKLYQTITVDGSASAAFLVATPTYVVKASKKFVSRVEELQ